MNVESERQSLLEQIEQHTDLQHQEGMSRVVTTELKVYGVRVPQLRQIARDWQRAHKKIAHEHLVALVEALWGGEVSLRVRVFDNIQQMALLNVEDNLLK